jgi:4-carboxymuconolactone decarboxylase
MDDTERRSAGMNVRRKVLGDVHVDRANAKLGPVNSEFQDFITRYAWGEIWTRPGLDHRTRRLLVLTATGAMGRWEEFRLHIRAGLEGGLAVADVKETLLQLAIYAGVPAANTGFHILQEVMEQLGIPADTA